MAEKKDCNTCKHKWLAHEDEPCKSCLAQPDSYTNYEPVFATTPTDADVVKDAEMLDEFDKMNMKKTVFNLCVDAAIKKAKLSATILNQSDIEDIIKQIEKIRR